MGGAAVAPIAAWWRSTPITVRFENLNLKVKVNRGSWKVSMHDVRYSRAWIDETVLKKYSPSGRVSKKAAAHGFLKKFFQKSLDKLYM